MKKLVYILFVVMQLSCVNKSTKSTHSEAVVKYELEQLANGFGFAEGPANDGSGNIYFSDIPNNKILIWTTDDQLKTYRENSNRANGLYFDNNRNLFVCEMGKGRIASIGINDDYKTIALQYNGKRFNEPNDLWIDKVGGIYFSDPKYGRGEMYQDGMHVYYISPNYDTVIRVCDDLEKPNGLHGTPDGKSIYITDSEAGKTYKYDIQNNGSLTNKTLFVSKGGDGMTVDKLGNIYIAIRDEKIIAVYSPDGTSINTIQVTETPSNVCFGGENGDVLFITTRAAIYRVKLNQ